MRKTDTISNQQGFASIVVALTLIIVLALLTVGFAQLARREQQTALNKQLANQAYYAAESGINDAYKDILTPASAGANYGKINTGNAHSDRCMTSADVPSTALTFKPNVDADTNKGISYSCLMVNLTPLTVAYDNVNPRAGHSLTFSNTDTLTSLTVTWSSTDGKTTARNLGDGFTANLDHWQSPGAIQFSLTPLADTSRPALIANTFNVMLYPGNGSANTVDYNPGQQAPLVGSCVNGTCSATINNIPGVLKEKFLIHFVNYYDASSITISARRDTNPNKFVDAQGVIDVTGKAHNVLKRLQVRVGIGQNVNNTDQLPDYALEAQDICKRQQTQPDSTTFKTVTGSDAGDGDPCSPN